MDMGSTSSNDITFVPKVRFEVIPQIGQQFDSLDDAQRFYNEYAREAGFSIRAWTTKKNMCNEITRREFVCYKQGNRDVENSNYVPKRKRGLTREGCNARIAFVKSDANKKFIVSTFYEIHNHNLTTPRKVHLLRSHRSIFPAKKALTQQLSAANVPIHQQISILELEAGGIDNIGCIEKDFYNARRDEAKMYAGHDAQMLYEYFEVEKEKNSEFYFSFNMDEENKLTHCFWADVECRNAYHSFGDVVVFDTTYNTNRYGMIFAPFVGVNNHGQTTLFGCAFLSDETTDSFSWLLQQFLSAMPAGPPKMIITDQDPAMAKAIAQILPNIVHRLCMWHILNKFLEKLDAVKWKDHYQCFHKCIWNSETPEQFETEWSDIIEKSGLATNEWLKSIYEIRSKWIPAFINDTFSAGMSSSQRAESCHAFFKSYVSKKNSLMDFVVRFARALKHQRHQELSLDHKDINEQPIMKTMFNIEKSMGELYTHSIFYKIQDELFQSMTYIATIENDREDLCIYNVGRADNSLLSVRKVVEEKSLNRMTCSCKKFESCGFICRHIFAAFSRLQLHAPLPSIYLLHMWTKSAKAICSYGGSQEIGSGIVLRHNTLSKLSRSIVEAALVNDDTYKIAFETLESLQCNLSTMMPIDGGQSSTPSVALSQVVCNDPEKVRAKGCGKRLKGGKEIATKKIRRCHGCGLTGQSHDKRNCPALNATNDS